MTEINDLHAQVTQLQHRVTQLERRLGPPGEWEPGDDQGLPYVADGTFKPTTLAQLFCFVVDLAREVGLLHDDLPELGLQFELRLEKLEKSAARIS